MIGRTVGHYEILEKLGQGGMGVVYKARDTRLDRHVALKFLPGQQSVSREAKQRFIREAQAASALDHANICTIHEINETEAGELYIAMGWYEGETLEDLLKHGPLQVERVTDLANQLAAALERAHDVGIAHRDIKPANIIVTKRGELKLLDFGLAKLASATRLTRDGTTLGTIQYMSPEQADAKESDERSDLWSFGVMLHQMLTGRLPFGGESPAAIMMSILGKDPSPLPATVPAPLAGIVEACLQKDPARRPVARDIRTGLSGSGADTAATIVISPGRRASRSLFVAGLIVVLIALGVWWMKPFTGGSPDSGLDPQRMVIAPFMVRGAPEFEYLGEGMVDLVSAKLMDAGSITVVDPRATVAMARELEAGPGLGKELAKRAGAGQFITGEILQAGDRIQIVARLHDATGSGSAVRQISEEGDAEDLFGIVDGLVAQLLAGALGDDGVSALAAATTSSLPALREFLSGERLMRLGLYRDAAAAYERAVDADSTFALAYYRISIAADWTDSYYVRTSVDRALRFADRLPARDRSLIAALSMRRKGDSTGAEQAYRSVLHQYPDDIEALIQLAEILFHDGPRRGRSILESLEPFQHVARLEPNNFAAQLHLARLFALGDSVEALQDIADLMQQASPEGERTLEVEALCAYVSDDDERKAALRTALVGRPWFYRWYAVHGIARFARDPAASAELLDLFPIEEPMLLSMKPVMMVVRGKIAEFREFMDSTRPLGNPSWELLEMTILTSGAVPPDPVTLTELVDRLRRADPAHILATSWLPPYEDLTERFMAFERDYFVALALIQIGRPAEARPIIDRMTLEAPFPGLGSLRDDAVKGLEAEILFRSGEFEAALEQLRRIRYDAPHAASVRAIADGSRSRLLRAELELEVGDTTVARNYFLAFDQSWSLWDTFQRPVVYQRLGEIAEKAGDPVKAAKWYGHLISEWDDCDPQLVPAREAIRHRRDALLAGTQP